MNVPLIILSVLAFAGTYVAAETHTVSFDNKCGFGTPTLIFGGNVVSTGAPYVSNGSLSTAIAYLQTGNCGFNGEGCTLLETTLTNPSCAGCGSSTDISLISPHVFSVVTGFKYSNGCSGSGANCDNPNCASAFRAPADTAVQVACEDNDVDLVITFCT